jgi:trichodiene synthase
MGDHEFPDFLRRLNGMGQPVGATIWPASKFDDSKLFPEMTTAICMLAQWEVVSDLILTYLIAPLTCRLIVDQRPPLLLEGV